jgi:nucleoside phosphorylase
MQPISTLVCFALPEEAAPFRKLCANRPGVSVLVTGIGHKNAERSARNCLQQCSPQRVFTCGFAGALNPSLKIGDVIFSTADTTLHAKLEGLGVVPGKFYCASTVATTAMEKTRLFRTTGADAVDMESEVIQTVCRERGIPCATVRVISDAANEDLPLDFNQLMTAKQTISVPKLILAIAKSPSSIPRLLQLQRNTRAAARSLAEVLVRLVA